MALTTSSSGPTGRGLNVRALIRHMRSANPPWGAPRLHGELRKFGIEVSQTTVHRWRTHLALDKDAPEPRTTQSPEHGRSSSAHVDGLHHYDERRAA